MHTTVIIFEENTWGDALRHILGRWEPKIWRGAMLEGNLEFTVHRIWRSWWSWRELGHGVFFSEDEKYVWSFGGMGRDSRRKFCTPAGQPKVIDVFFVHDCVCDVLTKQMRALVHS